MKILNSFLTIASLGLLFVAAPSRCLALMDVQEVSPAIAKELGLGIQAVSAGPDAVRVTLEFEAEGKLKKFRRVDLEIKAEGKTPISAPLREEPSKPGHIAVSFAADRADLDKVTLRVVVQDAPRDMTGYELRVNDFVEQKSSR